MGCILNEKMCQIILNVIVIFKIIYGKLLSVFSVANISTHDNQKN